MTSAIPALGAPAERREGYEKVTGTARYAVEHPAPGAAYACPVPATVARGRVVAVDDRTARAVPGVLAVLTPDSAPRLASSGDPTLAVLQHHDVPHRGWHVALVVAESPAAARAAADAVRVTYDTGTPDSVLTIDHPDAYTPKRANGGYPAEVAWGDPEAGHAAAPVQLDLGYAVPPLHNHPMEPHAATAHWEGKRLTVHDSCQGSTPVRDTLVTAFGLDPDLVTVVAEHVGGGFGAKGTPRPHVLLAAMAARAVGRPVRIALPRSQLPAVTGHRAPTRHRLRLAADTDGRLRSLEHTVTTHTSRIAEFVEQAAVPARTMYAVPHSRTTHRVVALDVPTPSWMRAPGECPGMYALETAMDELAHAVGVDPVELRIRNEPAVEPESGLPFSSRGLVNCLREGARRFGWDRRERQPGRPQSGALRTGSGVAAATYPALVSPSRAAAHARPDGTFRVTVNGTDIGTGARTVLAQVAADALDVPLERVLLDLGDSGLPDAPLAGGSAGTASWGWAVHRACGALSGQLADHHGPLPAAGLHATADTAEEVAGQPAYARHAFGAYFCEVSVDTVSGEVRVRRMLGVFAAGRILNARTAHSQFIGGMVMGIGMALTEDSTVDPAFGDFVHQDLAGYHVPCHADIPELQAHWLDESDPHLNPMGSKGIGEIGNVGTAAAVGNAVHHATGVRLRELPFTPDRVLSALADDGR